MTLLFGISTSRLCSKGYPLWNFVANDIFCYYAIFSRILLPLFCQFCKFSAKKPEVKITVLSGRTVMKEFQDYSRVTFSIAS